MSIATLAKITVPLATGDSPVAQGLLMPKLQYRFRVTFNNFGVSTPTTELTKQVIDVSRPTVSFDPIVVDVYNPDILPDLQDALVDYISHSEFINERLILNERNYQNEIGYLEKQLSYMDSLKVMLMSDCADLDGDAVTNLDQLNKNQNEIFGRIRDLQAALQFNMKIEVMDGFIAQQEPISKIYFKYILIGIVVGII